MIPTWFIAAVSVLYSVAFTALPFLASAQDSNCVPFAGDNISTRCGTTGWQTWWQDNPGSVTRLYQNGVYKSQESGGWSLNLSLCHAIHPNAPSIKVALLDGAGVHADRCAELIRIAAPGVQLQQFYLSRFYPEQVVEAFTNAVAWGANIVCLSITVINLGDPPNDVGLSNIIRQAQLQNGGVIVSCAVPNAAVTPPDAPSRWPMWNVLPATNLMMDGSRYPVAAWGYKVNGWPGRNIVFSDGHYSSGTSYASAIQAGVMALLLQQQLDTTSFLLSDQAAIAMWDAAITVWPPRANPLKCLLAWDANWFAYRFEQPSDE